MFRASRVYGLRKKTENKGQEDVPVFTDSI